MTTHIGPIEGVGPDDVLLNPVRLAIFCAVVESRSFARAAEQLAMSPANVSVHIRTLERLWGCSLFDRKRRGAQLTEAGQAAYEYASSVLRDTVNLRARLSDLAGGEGGTVTIGTSQVPATYTLPAILASFRHQYPGAHLRMLILGVAEQCEAVYRGEADFAIASENAPVFRSLRAEPLWVHNTVVVASPLHPLARQPRVTLTDIAGAEFITGTIPTIGEQALDAALAAAGLGPRRSAIEVGSFEVRKQLVLQNAGLAALFQPIVAEELAAGRLVALPIPDIAMTEEYRLVYRDSRTFSPLAQRLMDHIRAAARGGS